MRILLAVSMVPQADGIGAIPKLLHAQLLGLRERHEVTLVGSFGELSGQADAARELTRSGCDAHFVDRRRSASAARRWRVRGELAAAWARHPWPWRAVCAAAGLQPTLDLLAGSRRFDVVAVEEDLLSVLDFPAGVPVVLTEHEAHQAPGSGWRASGPRERAERAVRLRDWKRWEPFRRRAWEWADLVQVFSRGDAAAISRRSPEVSPRVRVDPFGIVPPAPADPARTRPGTLLFAGTFTHLPNRDAAVWLAREIMPEVRRRHPQANLRLVGTAPPREVLELAGPGVEVIADARSVTPHLQAAEVVLAPVRTGGGMRMKVLEAIAMGKAVVTTPLGAEGFTGFEPRLPFAVGEDAAQIAEQTSRLIDDGELRRGLAAHAREFALRHHSPESWARRLEVVYEEAASCGRRSLG